MSEKLLVQKKEEIRDETEKLLKIIGTDNKEILMWLLEESYIVGCADGRNNKKFPE